MRVGASASLGLSLVLACEAGGGATSADCIADLGPRLVVTTTDFSTGAVTIVDADDRCVQRDVALASTDAIPFADEDRVYIVNRHMADYVDVLDPAGWILEHEQAIEVPGTASANPQWLAFGPDRGAYLPLYGASTLPVYDLGAGELMDTIDLGVFADEDGIAEATMALAHGHELFVFLARRDRTDSWKPVGDDLMVVVDLDTRELVDLDPDAEGVDGMRLLGRWPRQWRSVPGAPGQVLVLGSGVQRIDLAARTTAWVLDEAQLAAAGIDAVDLPQSFDVSADGWLFLAAYTPGYDGVRIHRVRLDGTSELEPIVDGLNASERTLEVVADEIWFGDTTPGGSGMRVFDFEGAALVDAPLPTGLAPYSVLELPQN